MTEQVPRQLSGDESPTAEEDETMWARRENGRMRQISIGKARPEYRRYIAEVPKELRDASEPRTPEPRARVSKRQFDRDLGKWRRALHEWDSNQRRANGGALEDQAAEETGTGRGTPDVRTRDAEETGVVQLRLADELLQTTGPGMWQLFSPVDQPLTPAPLAQQRMGQQQHQNAYEGLETPDYKPIAGPVAWQPSGMFRCVGMAPMNLQQQFGFSPVKPAPAPQPSVPEERRASSPEDQASASGASASSDAGEGSGSPSTSEARRRSSCSSPPLSPRTPPAKQPTGRSSSGGGMQSTASPGWQSPSSVVRTPKHMCPPTPSPVRLYAAPTSDQQWSGMAMPFVVPLLPQPQHQAGVGFGGGMPWGLGTLVDWQAGMHAPPSQQHM